MLQKTATANSTRVILLRHGQSTYNERKLYQGCCDGSLLNHFGKIQANLSGKFLNNVNINTIYASPLKRTQETAVNIINIINQASDNSIRIKLHPNLKEIDLPTWQGLPFKYVRQYLAEDYRIWEEKPHEFTIETISTSNSTLIKTRTKPVLELYQKAAKFWQDILPQHIGKTILIVSHGGTIRALMSTALGIPASQFHTFQQSNCGISVLNFSNLDNSVELQAINLTQHLNEQLPKLKNGKQGLRLILLPINTENSQINLPNLSPLFQCIDVDFCISCNISKEEIDKYLTQNQTKPIINFHVSHQNFFPTWHQTICDRNISSLNTALVIADIEILRSLLNDILQLEPNSSQINIQQNNISVLFYPSYQNKAVIQAINISLLSLQN